MKVSKLPFLCFILSFLLLFSCSFSVESTTRPVEPLNEDHVEEYVSIEGNLEDISTSTRQKNKAFSDYVKQRTVLIYHDCSPKKDIKIFTEKDPQKMLDGYGSGSILRSSEGGSYIVTADHVIATEKKYLDAFECSDYIYTRDNLDKKVKFKAEVIVKSTDRDIAVLKVKEDLKVGSNIELYPFEGEDVWAVGYPAQLSARTYKDDSITRGVIATLFMPVINTPSGISTYGHYHRVTTEVYYGNSGGGLWTVEGNLTGVVVAMMTDDDDNPYAGYYYVKPINEVVDLLKNNGKLEEVFR